MLLLASLQLGLFSPQRHEGCKGKKRPHPDPPEGSGSRSLKGEGEARSMPVRYLNRLLLGLLTFEKLFVTISSW